MHQMSAIKVVVPYPGLTISVTHKLEFGRLDSKPGIHAVSKSGDESGRLTLTGVYRRLPIYLSVKAPDYLQGPADSIRFSGGAAFNDRADNAETSTGVSTSGEKLVGMTLSANRENWTGFAFLFLYGKMVVPPDARPGVYRGTYEITIIL